MKKAGILQWTILCIVLLCFTAIGFLFGMGYQKGKSKGKIVIMSYEKEPPAIAFDINYQPYYKCGQRRIGDTTFFKITPNTICIIEE